MVRKPSFKGFEFVFKIPENIQMFCKQNHLDQKLFCVFNLYFIFLTRDSLPTGIRKKVGHLVADDRNRLFALS